MPAGAASALGSSHMCWSDVRPFSDGPSDLHKLIEFGPEALTMRLRWCCEHLGQQAPECHRLSAMDAWSGHWRNSSAESLAGRRQLQERTPAPPLRSLRLRLIAFICDEPSIAIELAVRHSAARVLVLTSPEHRARVQAMGATWFNMTLAAGPSAMWAAHKYRHSSRNAPGYELFCFRRWLMLHEAMSSLHLPADSAIACLDDDILLYRDPAHWLREMAHLRAHADAQIATVVEGAFVFFSQGSLRSFAAYIHWLYERPTSELARELKQHGEPPQPIALLPPPARHRLSHNLVQEFNQSAPHNVYHHFSDMQARHAFCSRSASGSLPHNLDGARCSSMWQLNSADRRGISGSLPNCSIMESAETPWNSTVQFQLMDAAEPAQSDVGAAAAPSRPNTLESAAERWVALLHWRDGVPLAPDSVQRAASHQAKGLVRAVCLVHLQGPASKQLFMKPLVARGSSSLA